MKKKKGRVIFLTTHYMDEADILADRKLILNKGKIRCLGTSLYLKNHFNMKYNLEIETNDRARVHKLIQNYVPNAIYVENKENNQQNNRRESFKYHTWRLPLKLSYKFSALLNNLEYCSDNNNFIKKIALFMPTLEELFIRLEDETYDNEDYDNRHTDNDRYILNTDSHLPRLDPVEKPSSLKILYHLISNRLNIFLKDNQYISNAILQPAVINTLLLYIMNKYINNNSMSSSSSKLISINSMYNQTILNMDPQSNLGNIVNTIGINNDNYKMSTSLSSIKSPQYNEHYYLASVGGQQSQNYYQFQINYNDTMIHSIPAIINFISNSILVSKNINGEIEVNSYPFDTSNNVLALILSLSGFLIGFSIVSGLAKFTPLVVRERVQHLLQQLQLNGVSKMNYWLSIFISDCIIFFISYLAITTLAVLIKFEPLLDKRVYLMVIISGVLWSIPTILCQYLFSFMFNKEETAITIMNPVNIYSLLIGYIVLIFINQNVNQTDGFDNYLYSTRNVWINIAITSVAPTYDIVALLQSIFDMKNYNQLFNYQFNVANFLKFRNGFMPIIIVLLVLTIIYSLVLYFLDSYKKRGNKKNIYSVSPGILQENEKYLSQGDNDVKNEYHYVKKHLNELPLSVVQLSKEFKVLPPSDRKKRNEFMSRDPEKFTYGEVHPSIYTGKLVKTAVIDVNFGVKNHECFGLLGPNGAGKSTTLNCITLTISLTTGKVCFNGIDVYSNYANKISMGYCPQEDILWKEMTVREHIEFFLKIRGYVEEEAKNYATQYIEASGLEDHQHKRTDEISGGTKRKLSILIAICSYPKQILLDEPTAGMDPSTRRFVWNIIKETKNMNNSALIMTTHSMEEAENLCDRLGILVNGRIICIGSPEHLKMKYGEDYILELQSNNIEMFHKKVVIRERLFGDCNYKVEKSSFNRVKYEVHMTRNLGKIFEVMEHYKSLGLVIDYSFNQASLEQIFIKFAKMQIINTEH